ncbi:MAG: ABC transporter substrate-binding protein [Gordonia amarae]
MNYRTVFGRHSLLAAAPMAAVLLVTGCDATAPSDEATDTTAVTLTNCGKEVNFNAPVERVVATSNSANVGTILKVGGLDRLAAVSLNKENDAVLDSMFGTGIAEVPHLQSSSSGITMETILGTNADLVVGSYSGLFKGATGITPESLGKHGIGAYIISDSCRQGEGDDAAMGTMDPWDALRADVTNYGTLFGTEDKAKAAGEELDKRLDRLKSATKPATPLRVLIYDSGEEDLYTSGGNGAPNGIIDAAGGVNVFGDIDNTWFRASWETVAKADPDVIVIMDYKKTPGEVDQKIAAIKARAGLRDTKAVQQNRFVVLPLAMFTSGYPNIYGAEQLRAKMEGFGVVPDSGTDFTQPPK